MAGSGAEMAAMFNTIRSITDRYVMKMPAEERKEYPQVGDRQHERPRRRQLGERKSRSPEISRRP
jgi:hypothetical protein